MSRLIFLYAFFIPFWPGQLYSQVHWDGGAGTDQWNDAVNWANDRVPATTDLVVLDNSVVHGSYMVQLPGGNAMVTVASLSVSPGAGNHIELVLPAENVAVPGFVATGPGYGLHLYSGAVFRNASGAESGTPVTVSDSIRIDNGARYIHNTARGHASNVQVLSSAPGTEAGIMEFDVPAASTTISLSGRTYGTLILSGTTLPADTVKYTAAGTNGATIRGDLEIASNVKFGLNFSDSIMVGRNLIDSGVFDLGNTDRSVVVGVAQDLVQSPGGLMMASGTGEETILLNSRTPATIDCRGKISTRIALMIETRSTVTLQSPLALPYLLSLRQGQLVTSASALLTLGDNASVECDTVSGASFIVGPIRKTGLVAESFTFPVGAGSAMRWLQLTGATGTFTVDYQSNNPKLISSLIGATLDHLSEIEYWDVLAEGPSPAAQIKTSFRDPISGGVTNLTDLRVARLVGNRWENAGNMSTGGSAGLAGWVSSERVSAFSPGANQFALASATPAENPLPFTLLQLSGNENPGVGRAVFHCSVTTDQPWATLVLQKWNDKGQFADVDSGVFNERQMIYLLHDGSDDRRGKGYRVCLLTETGAERQCSGIVQLDVAAPGAPVFARPQPIPGGVLISVTSGRAVRFQATVFDIQGRSVGRLLATTGIGYAKLRIPFAGASRAVYLLHVVTDEGAVQTFSFLGTP